MMPKLPEGVRKVPGGYQARVQTRRRRVSKSFSTASAAKQWRDTQLGRGAAGVRLATISLSLGDYLIPWLDRLDVAANTRASYRVVLRLSRTPIWTMKLRELDPEGISEAYQMIADGPRGPKGGDPLKVVDRVHTALHAALEDLVEKRDLPANPAHYAVRTRSEERLEREPWSEVQVRLFLSHPTVRGDYLYPLWRLLLASGLRLGEALGIRDADVDLDLGMISIVYQFTREEGRAVYKELKTKRSRRTVSIVDDSETIRVLAHFAKQKKETRLASGQRWHEDPKGRFFAWGLRSGKHGGLAVAPGTPVHPSRALNSRLDSLIESVGLPRITIHDLRHTHATILLRKGVPLHKVSLRLGHSSSAITERVYAHFIPGDDREASGVIASVMDGPLSGQDGLATGT